MAKVDTIYIGPNDCAAQIIADREDAQAEAAAYVAAEQRAERALSGGYGQG